jgi:hypothetical protein
MRKRNVIPACQPLPGDSEFRFQASPDLRPDRTGISRFEISVEARRTYANIMKDLRMRTNATSAICGEFWRIRRCCRLVSFRRC